MIKLLNHKMNLIANLEGHSDRTNIIFEPLVNPVRLNKRLKKMKKIKTKMKIYVKKGDEL